MCGISGVLDLHNRSLPEENLEAMSNALRHRGPDDQGSLIDGPIALGFRRLSIVDLARGHQPMANEDGTIWIVFNGEIYNHSGLRLALQQRGHCYSTNSDTETILHLYEEYGDDCVHHLRGMFAFAIWDGRQHRLFCARDRLGIKPFYYAMTDGRFAFASEIKALLKLPGLRPRLNRRAMPEFFALGYLSSEETLFEGIRKLLPGHRLHIDLKAPLRQPAITQYWDVDLYQHERELPERDYVARFEELFTETVGVHLMSDVPLGVFLSGGLDSSSIAAVVAALRKDRIRTFSVGYAEDSFSELPYARLLARHLGTEHHEVVLGPAEFFASLPQLIWHEDEPLVWPSSVALYHVSRLANEHVKVVLTGEGADEILAGYLKYRAALLNLRVAPAYRKVVPEYLRRLLRKALSSGFMPQRMQRKLWHTVLYHSDSFEKIHFDNFYSVFPQHDQPQLFTSDLGEELRGIDAYANSMRYFPSDVCPASLLNRLLYLDVKTYLVELLMKQDQMSMAASIESRVPFLDHQMVEFAAQVPARYKVRGFSGKYLLRRAIAKRLPAAILRRSKRGFPTPIQPWLRHQLFENLASVLTDGRMEERGLIRPDYVRQLLRAHGKGFSQATEGCWRLLNFELWNRIFVDGDNRPLTSQVSYADGLTLGATTLATA